MIRGVAPEVDGGRLPARGIAGDAIEVEADILVDGTDLLRAVLLSRRDADEAWSEAPLEPVGNDRWRGRLDLPDVGTYRFTLEAWVDPFATWQRNLRARLDASQEVAVDLRMGADLVRALGRRADEASSAALSQAADVLAGGGPRALELAASEELARLAAAYPDRSRAVRYDRELSVAVDRERARFSAWYEVFPRSCSPDPRRPGTFRDVEAFLPYVAGMGFDVLYFPPIHPIGRTHRKGRNNAVLAGPEDPGSPWAIGSAEGGHKAIHPDLGTLADFQRLLAKARDHGLEIALDLAFQCSADHPYLKEHPDWFHRRPDGTIQYAENPPKKYEDIYPFDFETPDWRALWGELESVVRFWIDQGVRIFRVDNPHTKPFAFWEAVLGNVRADHPDVLFLSEAFTRPKIMYRLSQLGFTQSYTYFAWRNTKAELEAYFTELTTAPVREFFRPSLWPNTPDIQTQFLQASGRAGFAIRLVLAATLGASYGIYGPAFELQEHRPREPGSEEYLNSEKYEIKHWEVSRTDSLRELITTVNRARRDNPALQQDATLRFHEVDNGQMICYSKRAGDNVVLVVVNLDPRSRQAGWTRLDLGALGIHDEGPFEVHDLLVGARYAWRGARNFVELDPRKTPAHLFRVGGRSTTSPPSAGTLR